MLVDPRPGLRAYLAADPAVTAIVGNRIYPVQLPQGIRLASLVYSRISEIESYHNVGPSALMQTRFQFDSVSPNVDEATLLADAVKERLGGFAGAINYAPPNGVLNVEGIFFDMGREDYDGELSFYRMSRDFFVWYKERNG
jgi:hypothetical protein